jgi:hypothetical protein
VWEWLAPDSCEWLAPASGSAADAVTRRDGKSQYGQDSGYQDPPSTLPSTLLSRTGPSGQNTSHGIPLVTSAWTDFLRQ